MIVDKMSEDKVTIDKMSSVVIELIEAKIKFSAKSTSNPPTPSATSYEESVVDKFKSNLLLMIIWLNIINYNT